MKLEIKKPMPKNIKVYKDIIPPKLCRQLIELFESDSNVKPDPQPDYSSRDYAKITDLSEKKWGKTIDKLYEKIEAITQDYFERPDGMEEVSLPEWSDDGLVMSKYKPGDSLILHVDGHSCTPPTNHLRLATLIIYLNTVEEGGETHFPLQKRQIKPKTGQCIIFPPTINYPHEVFPSDETRFIIQTWIVDPYLLVVPNENEAKD